MKLTDLNPRWFVLQTDGQRVGLTFECPHCRETRLGIVFHRRGYEAIDDAYVRAHHRGADADFIWTLVSGEDFDTLTVTPSVNAEAAGHWHGFITNGEIR
jgi:hypothetical protein